MSGYQDPGADPAHEWAPVAVLQKSCATDTFAAHTLVLNVPRPPITANQSRSQHWRKSHAAKREVAQYVALLAQVQQIPALGPTHVTVTWYAPDMRRRDVDALGPFLKAALDALVDSGVFPDDNWQHVPATTTKIQLDRKRPRLEIHLQEVTA